MRYKLLFDYVSNGDWDNAKTYLLELGSDASHAVRARDSRGDTAIHVAVLLGHVHIVKELVKLMTEQDLEIKNNIGSTPLHVLVHNCKAEEHVIEMARYMVEKNNRLLTISSPVKNCIPVVDACGWNKWELGRYLYSVTPPEALMADNGPHGAVLTSICLSRMKMLGTYVYLRVSIIYIYNTCLFTRLHILQILHVTYFDVAQSWQLMLKVLPYGHWQIHVLHS